MNRFFCFLALFSVFSGTLLAYDEPARRGDISVEDYGKQRQKGLFQEIAGWFQWGKEKPQKVKLLKKPKTLVDQRKRVKNPMFHKNKINPKKKHGLFFS